MTFDIKRDQPVTGPFLDRLFSFVLPSGRRVVVRGFIVRPTNSGIMEGGLSPHINDEMLEAFVARAKALFGDPVFVVEPRITPLPEISRPGYPRERLPWMACAADLFSEPVSDKCESSLTLVWFQDSFDSPLPQEIERAAAGLCWELIAQDYDWI